MSSVCLDDCYNLNGSAIAPGTRSHDVAASCFGDGFHLLFCVRAASVTALAALTLLLSLYHVARAGFGGGRPYRLFFFLAAAVEMGLLALFFGWVLLLLCNSQSYIIVLAR